MVALKQPWGATTVLQLAVARPCASLLSQSCEDLRDPPTRNLSWVLQCNFLTSANRAGGGGPGSQCSCSPP